MTAIAEQITIPATTSQVEFIIRPPVPVEVPAEIRTSTAAQAVTAAAQELVHGGRILAESAKNAAASLGRWVVRHRIGVSYAVSGVAFATTLYNAAKGAVDSDYYNTVTDTINAFMGVESVARPARDSASENIAVGGIAGVLSATSLVTGFAFRDDKRERGEL